MTTAYTDEAGLPGERLTIRAGQDANHAETETSAVLRLFDLACARRRSPHESRSAP